MLDTKSLNELSKKIHQDNVERGFYDEQREVGTNLIFHTYVADMVLRYIVRFGNNRSCGVWLVLS